MDTRPLFCAGCGEERKGQQLLTILMKAKHPYHTGTRCAFRMLWSITVVWAFRKKKSVPVIWCVYYLYKKHTLIMCVFLQFLQEQIDCSWATVPNSRV